jgi:hypothetical protein
VKTVFRKVSVVHHEQICTGETLAREQVEAGGKEQVLRALSQAATQMREKLGESLAGKNSHRDPDARTRFILPTRFSARLFASSLMWE